MRGVIRLSLLPLLAFSLLLLGCGVEIAPEAITATAVAEQEASAGSTFGGSASAKTAQELLASSSGIQGAPVQTAEPISTLTSPTQTQEPDASAVPESTSTVEPDETPEVEETASEDAEATETPEAEPTLTATPEPTTTALPVVTNANQNYGSEFMALLNAQRTGRGMGALTANVILTNGATEFAGYMGTAGFFGHDAPDGSTPASRAQSTGYTGAWNGEALSAGQATPQSALNALLASAPHAAILLDPKAVEVGIGYVFVEGSRYRHYWVVMTGIP